MPPQRDGVEWRLLGPEDAQELTALIRALEFADQSLFRTTKEEVEQILGRHDGWRAVGAFQENGTDGTHPNQLIAFGHVALAKDGSREASCQGGVAVDARGMGIGSELIAWETQVAQALLAEAFPGQECQITHSVPNDRRHLQKRLEALGYQWRNSYAELRLPIADIPPKTQLPSMMDITPWTPEWDDPTRRAYNKMTALVGAGAHLSRSGWQAMHQSMVREWSFVASDRRGDRPRVAGIISVGSYPQDWEALGWKEGFTSVVAVMEPELRRNVLLALVRSAMKAQKKAGVDAMAVGLDPEQNTEMLQLYLDLGFEVSAWSRTYSLRVQTEASA